MVLLITLFMEESGTLMLIDHHGCGKESVEGILKDNFRCSEGEDYWLGNGAYFFGEGISDPVEDARRWACLASKKKGVHQRLYKEWAVIKAMIVARKPLNLNTDEGKRRINQTREAVRKRIHREPLNGFEDLHVVRFLIKTIKFDVVIQDFWVRFEEELEHNIRSRSPNTRVILVVNPASSIDKENIVLLKTGPTEPPP